jgi:hypothetical protein
MLHGHKLAAAAFGGLLFALPAAAEEGNPAPTCRHGGERYALGELACITVCPQQARLVRCEMSLNNTSWTHVSDVCPITMNAAPTVVAMTPWPAAAGYSAFVIGAPVTTAASQN